MRELIKVLEDGETYLWEELERFFDVAMDERGKAMFRRAMLADKRLYSPLAHPARGLGVVMAEGRTVADNVEDQAKRAYNATAKVIETIDIAYSYDGVPASDKKFMRAMKAHNQMVINSRLAKPIKKKRPRMSNDAGGREWSPSMLGAQ